MRNKSKPNKERQWVVYFSLIVVIITTMPYLRAWLAQGTDWVFTGFLIGVEDGNSYIAKMLLGARGAWLFKSPYSTEVQSGAIVFLPYLLLGKIDLALEQHANLVMLFHLYRIFSIFILSFATYRFIAHFIKTPGLRRWALALSIGGGGFGWLLLTIGRQNWLGSLPLEFYSPESFGFLSVFGIPHLAVSRAFLLIGFIAFLERRPLQAGLYWFLMGFFQPVTVVIGWVVLGVYLGALAWGHYKDFQWLDHFDWSDWRLNLKSYIWTVLISTPMVVYSTLVFWFDPYLKAWKWGGQNTITSPHPLHYLMAYGLVLIFITAVAKKIIDNLDAHLILLVVWLAVLPFLIYFPVDFQRRLADGIWVVLVVLMMKGFELAAKRLPSLAKAGISFMFLSTVLIMVGAWKTASSPSKPVFLPSNLVDAFEFLNTAAPENSVILSSYHTSNAIPAWARVQVVVGHGPESINLRSLLEDVSDFFGSSVDDDQRQVFIEEMGISYILYGPDERSLGEWDPKTSDLVSLEFFNDEYYVYSIMPIK